MTTELQAAAAEIAERENELLKLLEAERAIEQQMKQQQDSLRDQMAMAALAGMLANPKFNHGTGEDVAEASYEAADVMMKIKKRRETAARKKGIENANQD